MAKPKAIPETNNLIMWLQDPAKYVTEISDLLEQRGARVAAARQELDEALTEMVGTQVALYAALTQIKVNQLQAKQSN